MKQQEKIEEKIKRLEKELEEAKEQLKRTRERFRPTEGKKYYFLNSYQIECDCFSPFSNQAKARYANYNCFETKEDARREVGKIVIRRRLEAIAKRLNDEEEIDWNDREQNKFFIGYDHNTQRLDVTSAVIFKTEGAVYCLHSTILKEAIKEIGEEELIDYIIN